MIMEITKGTSEKSEPPSRFALAAALRNLALLPHEFRLVSDAADSLVIRLLVAPVRDPDPPGPE
jgi:hypothetical protein